MMQAHLNDKHPKTFRSRFFRLFLSILFLVFLISAWFIYRRATETEETDGQEPDHRLQITMPWTLEWAQKTIEAYPEQELELERYFDWVMQAHLQSLYELPFITEDRILVSEIGFDQVQLTYRSFQTRGRPELEKEVNVYFYFTWPERQIAKESDVFLEPDMQVQINFPYEREVALARMVDDIEFYHEIEAQIHSLVIDLLLMIYEDVQPRNLQTNRFLERGIDEVVIMYFDENSGALNAVQMVAIWDDSDEFGIHCWFSFHDDIDLQTCD